MVNSYIEFGLLKLWSGLYIEFSHKVMWLNGFLLLFLFFNPQN